MVRGLALREMGRNPAAVEAFTQAITLNGANPQYFVHRATVYIAMNQLEAGQRDVDSALQRQSGNADAIALRGQIHMAAGRIDEAMSDFNQVLVAKPDHKAARLGKQALLAGMAIRQIPNG